MSYGQCECVILENLKEGHSIPAMTSTTDFFSQLHLDHHQYYSSFPMTNNSAAGTQAADGTEAMNTDYCQDPPQGRYSRSTLAVDDVDVDYEVQDQEDGDYELLVGLRNIHVEKEEERSPWPTAAAVSSWEWPQFGGSLESIVDQAACLVPPVIHVPDHGVDHGNEVEQEEDDGDKVVLLEYQEYCDHMAPQVADDMENTVVQFKPSMCNSERTTVEEKDEHNQYYSIGHNSTPSARTPAPPPYHYSQREARKITEKRQMHRGKSSTTISSSIERSRATILHNNSERKRRGKINEKMETLHKLIPNYNKTDKASMLDKVIDYVKKLQSQNDEMMIMMTSGMFDNNNMPASVHPMMTMMQYMKTMQQQQHHHHQQQMYMMTQMSMGMGMGMGMMPTAGSVMHANMRRE